MEYELAAGVRKTDARSSTCSTWRWRIPKAEIEKILTDYGVPLVQCSTCLVQGNLPSHGAYIKPASLEYKVEARSRLARSGGHGAAARDLAGGRRRPDAGAFQRGARQ